MAKFLDTTGVSYHLQQLINKSNERLVLISPYLKINERIKQSLEDKDRLKIDIRVIYGKNELQPEENNWLKSMTSIRSSFCKDLHAKCYLNENEAIITSMNLYEFSQVNNNEMGIYVVKDSDPELYNDIYKEVQRLIRISDEIIVSIEKAPKENILATDIPKSKVDIKTGKPNDKPTGFCIRTGVKISFNPERPLSYDAFQVWNQFGDIDYPERFCHFSGEPSNGETSVRRPILWKNWKKAKEYIG
ncbi:phospholipase D family protein [Pontibacter ramchanderi]|uniref:Phospholipase D-like protein n=1 Tax=Pontibacter ramchanderi TaxID=1179743 RepID=A0A2N3V270_9BACT|nr:phospholipase D family protein [Pontibacter ramchanderi]PKV75729.1 phospholipase D-like protein [Pontibacter ramchanderi]